MYQINEDNSIYVTRGDIVVLSVEANKHGVPHTFQAGEVLRINVYGKKAATNVVLQKDFPVTKAAQTVDLFLSEEDTKFGAVISKPRDYWYEVVLNPFDNPQTIIGYDEDGPKIFRLFPEGADLPEYVPDPEVFKTIDTELDMTSEHPVQNQVIARAFANLQAGYQATHDAVANLHVTPQMFGAIGDGVADDTEALQMACAGDGAVLNLPEGTYHLGGQVVIDKNISIASVSSVIVGCGIRVDGVSVSVSGLRFQDITANAIEVVNGGSVVIDNCTFENIGVRDDLHPSYEGCGVYASGEFDVRVYDSVFTGCHGHGAVFCNDGGMLEIRNSRFSANDYRAVEIVGKNETKGVIAGNYIEDCGKNNTTGSGVGCNGIYATNGKGVTVESNTILNSRENAIEGAFLKVVGNYISGTGVEIETKPTPSIEGIFVYPSAPAYLADNYIVNAKGYGIKVYKDTAITEPVYIKGNVIRACGNGAIDINSPVSVGNVSVVDNIVDGAVNLNNADSTCAYVGDISKLSGRPDISRNQALLDYHHYFDNVSPLTYSNCSPTIKTSNGVSYVEVAYQEYAKLIYALPALKNVKHLLDFTVCGKGSFAVNLTKNNTYYASVLSVNNSEFVEKHYIVPVRGELQDKFKISIEFSATSCIKTMDVCLYR